MKHIIQNEMKKKKLTKKQLEEIIGGYYASIEPKPSDEPIIILGRR